MLSAKQVDQKEGYQVRLLRENERRDSSAALKKSIESLTEKEIESDR